MYSEEQIQRATNIDIVSFAESKGFEPKKQGSQYRISGYGGLMVNPEKNSFYIHSRQEGGYGCIDFCRKVLGMNFREALSELVGEGDKEYKRYEIKNSATKEKVKFAKPESASDCKRVYAYLINQRGISAELITELIRNKLLYQDKNGNAVFVHRDKNGNPVGADIQGTLSEKRYKGVSPGSEGSFVYQKGDTYNQVYIFEAPIDLISYVQMHPEVNNARFVSMGGLKPTLISEYIDNLDLKVVSCVDNDVAGKNFNRKILFDKMIDKFKEEALSERQVNIEEETIRYSVIKKDDKIYSLFVDEEDAKMLGSTTEGIQVKWKNTSNFTINTECKENNVKDFNELLIKNGNKDLLKKTNKINAWASKVDEKITEMKKDDIKKENLR